MNIVIGMSHPKHVYIFKGFIEKVKKNNKVLILVNDKEIVVDLLKNFKIDYKIIGSNQKKIFNKILQIFKLSFLSLTYAKKFKADIFIGVAFPHFAISSFLFRKPFIMVEDTESAKNLYRLIIPFTSSVITSDKFHDDFKSKHIQVKANLECAYLHPQIFKPSKRIFEHLNLKNNESYIVLRFVSWNAFHDRGHSGLSLDAKEKAVEEFSKYGKVLISSEDELEGKYKKYQLNIPIQEIHSLEYYADLVFGESPTMTTESAMLGTPSICVSSWAGDNLSNFNDLNHNGLSYSFKPDREKDAIRLGVELLQEKTKSISTYKAIKYMSNQINLTEFFVWFVLNYPESHKIMQKNSEYQERFK